MTSNKKNNEFINIHYYIDLFTKNWWLFGICIFLAMIIAYIVNKQSQPVYRAHTSLVINEDNNSVSQASAKLMQDIGFLSSDKNYANELIVLKSTPLIKSAIDKLNLRISYFQKKTFGKKELYKSAPFIVILTQDHPQPINCKISIKILSDKTYKLKIEKENVQIYSFISDHITQILPEYNYEKENRFDETITTDNFSFKVILNKGHDLETIKKDDYWFTINNDRSIIRSFQSAIEIQTSDLESTVANIYMNTTMPEKAVEFLYYLNEAYLDKDIKQKQHISEKTVEYINNQLNKVSESLDLAEDDLQKFRSNKKVIDISMQAEQIFSELNELKNEKARLTVNLKYVDYIQDYFKNNTQYTDLITPAAMGIDDPTLNSLVEELIYKNAEKASFIENNQEKSPYLQKINIRIDNLRSMISENIVYIRKTTDIALEDANSRIFQLNNEIRKMPETERELIGIERVFNINNNIYTYLLEKKSEAEIAKASYTPSIEVVEPADILDGIVSPKKKNNYAIAFILGFLIPFGYLRISDLLVKTITHSNEIEKLSGLPILGKIYHSSKNIENVVRDSPNSRISESFRMILINLNYFLNGSTSNSIAITSTISGEGKSFIALNLAQMLAKNNYRTILAGFDIRKPKEYSISNINSKIGISEYLSNQANLEDIIQTTNDANLDIVIAGKTPPNPAELLASDKTKELIEHMKGIYDYIIIDTPPVGVVSDGFSLMNKTDLNIFVSRLKYTPKSEFEEVVENLKNKKIINSIIINDVPFDGKKNYGYGYYTA